MKKLLLLLMAMSAPFVANADDSGYKDITFLRTYFDEDPAENFNLWTVVDANNDGHTWCYKATSTETDYVSGHTYYNYSTENDADDWLISPAITLEKDQYVTYWCYSPNGDYTSSGSMDFWYGNEPKVSAMTKGAELTNINGDYDVMFTIKAKAGVPLYLGIHANTKAGPCNLLLGTAKAKVYNVAPTAIVSPTSGEKLGEVPVTVALSNIGETEYWPSVYYIINDDSTTYVCDDFVPTIEPGQTLNYTFSKKADLSKPGTYKITVGTLDYAGVRKLDSVTVNVTNGPVSSSVVSAVADSRQITVSGSTVSAPEANGITVYDAGGNIVLSASGSQADISSLSQGVYVIKADGYKSLKVSK